jgi:hypothetical protein
MKFIKDNPIKLIFICLLLGVVTYRIATAEPKGFCAGKTFNGKTNTYLTNEEFIQAWLSTKYLYELADQEDHHGMNIEGDIEKAREMAKSYHKLYKGCCKVYRDSADGIEVHSSLWNRAFWRFQTIAVVTTLESHSGEGGYAVMNACGYYLDSK